MLARFRNEVRIARQVSHPNVCRVYDLAVVEGTHFLSMEYIDGEDLASLLRRIGRLPQDKAIEFARKICAGLAAAHERGVLHRDLKPANIMIDGRGQPRITDFGLAGLAAEIPLSDIGSGTPAYMSPEQKAGKDVTVRSDLYALGLVLFEMFTGKSRTDSQSGPSGLVKDLDPAVEVLILRCLEDEPKRRPSSALNVAMALPGGDPIAAALAAGETPSPEMVAASQGREGFSPRTAALCFASIVLAAIVSATFHRDSRLLQVARLDIPPDALAFKAQSILKQFGYGETPRSTAHGFLCCGEAALKYVNGRPPTDRNELFSSHRPPILAFWYRQHRDLMVQQPAVRSAGITYFNPPALEPGMIRLRLDALGRLLLLEVRPTPEQTNGAPPPAEAAMWSALLTAAELNTNTLSEAAPTELPTMPFDTRRAWVGRYNATRTDPIRVEAAAWRGRPVFFYVTSVIAPSTRGTAPVRRGPPVAMLALLTLVGAALLVRNHLRVGRGDRRGAATIATVGFCSLLAASLLTAAHVPRVAELDLLLSQMGEAMAVAAVLWAGYIAAEPYVRRFWPESLISWSRLLNGRVRDPLVASHVLAGVTAWWILLAVGSLVYLLVPVRAPQAVPSLSSASSFLAELATVPAHMFVSMIGFLVVVVLLRVVVRRRLWVGDVLASMLFALTGPVDFSTPFLFTVTFAFSFAVPYTVLRLIRRFGFVAMLAAWMGRLLVSPLAFGTWYTGQALVAFLFPAAVGAWAAWVIVSDTRRFATESVG